ncbi:MAG TPA: nuclear transport factor 2 family protein [Pyrinomonadaceae bacterium]|nr:nuclear transport factor 2 family protein [Pyrinomonadaceae bacterium]
MKSKFPQTALALMVAMLAFASFGCQPTADSNVNSTLTTNRNSGPEPEPVNEAAIKAELLKLEREWAGAAKNRDADAARRILADDLIITYPDGVVATKAEEVSAIESGAITADSWELPEADVKVTVLNASAAFVTGRGIIGNGKYKDPKSPKPIDISGEYRFLDVYAKRNGKWQAVASQTTRIAAPAPPTVSPAPTTSPAASPAATAPR